MRVLVPVAIHAKDQRKYWIARAFLTACLWTLGACSTAAPAAVDNGTAATGGITVTIAKPTSDDLKVPFATTIALNGTLALDKGVTLKKASGITVSLGDKLTVDCSGSGNKFNCSLDTTGTDPKTGKPLVGCNEIVTVTVTANGTQAGVDVSGSASVDVEIDNCAATVQLTAIPAPVGSPMPVFVGQQKLGVVAIDNRLQSASLDVVDPDGTSVLPNGAVIMPAGTTIWKFEYTLDTSSLTKTEKLQVVLKAKDLTNDEQNVTLDVYSVRSATFLGAGGDAFSGVINDAVVVSAAEAPDGFVAFTSDPTPTSGLDHLTDVVVGAGDGVYVRAGMPRRDGAGKPVDVAGNELAADADTHAHSLNFEFNKLAPDISLSKYRAIHYGTQAETDAKANANVVRVFVRDLDADGDLDILAVVNVTGDGDARGELWAILNVPATVKTSGTDAAGKPVDVTVNLRAFKVVDVMKLPARARTAELADLTGDGLDDVLIGAMVESQGGKDVDLGLMTLVLRQNPVCNTPSDAANPTKPCGDSAVDYTTLKNGQVFGADVKVAPNMGVTGVTSIASGPFYAGDGIDVCVGSADRPIVSCYRNVAQDGSLNQAQDAYQILDASDTKLIRAVDLTPANDKDGMDLLVTSESGKLLRWLRGHNNGLFTFIEDQQGVAARQVLNINVLSLNVAKIGPKGEAYVLAGVGGQEIQIIPLDTTDQEFLRACFRGWVIGGESQRVSAADIDGDGVLDIVNTSSDGVEIGRGETKSGKFTGGFIAPPAHHLCASYWPPGGRGIQEIVVAQTADFNKDKKKELLVIGKESTSDQPGDGGSCPLLDGDPPLPVWPIAVFMNEGGQLNPEPRQLEVSPYHPLYSSSAGLVTDCQPKGGGPQPFGHVTAAAIGDLNGDGFPDLVTVRSESAYDVGIEKPPPKDCVCLFDEQNEVDNKFGAAGPTGDKYDAKKCCFNFYTLDTDKQNPLVGFGGGAPWVRASTAVFLSNSTGPLGMKATCNALPPKTGGAGVCVTAPTFAFAGGRNPLDVRIADIDGDAKPDIITAMDVDGQQCFSITPQNTKFLESRIRVFQNQGKGVFAPTFIGDTPDKLSVRDTLALPNCKNAAEVAAVSVSYRFMPEQLMGIGLAPWPNPKTGKLDPMTIFGVGHAFGQAGIVPHLDKFNFASHVTSPVGMAPDAFSAADVNGDGIADMLVLGNTGTSLAMLTGKLNNANPKDAAFDTQTVLSLVTSTFPGAVAAAMGDVNNDGNLDLVLVSKLSAVSFLLGTGTGGFVSYASSSVSSNPLGLEISDVDADGCQDLIVRSKFSVTVVHNEGRSLTECAGALSWAHDVELATPH